MGRWVLFAYLVRVAIAGSTWAAIKIGIQHVPPWTLAVERAAIVGLALTTLSIVLRLPFPKNRTTIAAAVSVGLLNIGATWSIIFWAQQFVPSGLVAVFGATAPIWTALLAHFLVAADRLSVLKIAALGSGFAGIVVLVVSQGAAGAEITIAATCLLAAIPLCWSLTGIVTARYLRAVSPVPAVAIGAWTGTLVLLPLALTELGRPVDWNLSAILALGYLAIIGSALTLVISLWLYRSLRPTTVALAELLITVEAVIIGAFVLNEQITPGMLVGAGLVLLAVALNARASRSQRGILPEATVTNRQM